MLVYTIDYLLQDINQIVQKPSAESLRVNTMTNVRHVFERIGYEFVAEPGDFEIIIKDGQWDIPRHIVKIIDLGPNQYHPMGAKIRDGYATSGFYNYRETPTKLLFPNITDGKLVAYGYQFVLDEKGNPIIPEKAYQACYDFCVYKSLMASMNPKNPLWMNLRNFKTDAEVSISTARGLFNEPSDTIYRTQRKLS